MTYNNDARYEKLFKQAAKTSMLLWRNGDSEGYQDLAHDLWVHVLERPSALKKLSECNNNEAVAVLKNMARQLLSDQQYELNLYRQVVFYSSENVKDVLKGRSTNKYLADLLPIAFERLKEQYADALKSRYVDGVSPADKSGQNALVRAHKSLTEIVNALCIADTARDSADKLRVKDGPGSKAGKFPQDSNPEAVTPSHRRAKGGHSDPVAAQALALLERPEIEEQLLYQEPITEWTQPPRRVVNLPDGRRYRLSSEEQRRVKVEPAYISVVIEEAVARC